MKVLYALQGTGNGHIARARHIIPKLKQKVNQLDILVSGNQVDLFLNHPISYNLVGVGFIFGKQGGVSISKTLKNLKPLRTKKEFESLLIRQYDLVINDFEPISAWACKLHKVPCVGLSHQIAVLDQNAPRPKKKAFFSQLILKYYAPCHAKYGFHFTKLTDTVYPPVIRSEVKRAKTLYKSQNSNHITVYLPSYGDENLITIFRCFPEQSWHIFSKHTMLPYRKESNIIIEKIDNESFIKSMSTSNGVLCGAGFETPSESLFLNKKLLVIPMQYQYEQLCNACFLEKIGVTVLNSLYQKNTVKVIKEWLSDAKPLDIDYTRDYTDEILDKVLDNSTSFKI